jgi:hypothetical protein
VRRGKRRNLSISLEEGKGKQKEGKGREQM